MSWQYGYYPQNCHKGATDSTPEPYFRVMQSCDGELFVVTKRYRRTYKKGAPAWRWKGITYNCDGSVVSRDWDKRSVKQAYPFTIAKKKFK